jgi:hypothetical protein
MPIALPATDIPPPVAASMAFPAADAIASVLLSLASGLAFGLGFSIDSKASANTGVFNEYGASNGLYIYN